MSRTLLLTALALLVAGTVAEARTIKVPKDAADLSAALAMAVDGDVIAVSPGTYPGGVLVTGVERLQIRGKKAVIDGAGATFGLRVQDSVRVKISGITVRGSDEHGIELLGSQRVNVTKCRVEAAVGAGVQVSECADVVLSGVVVSGGSSVGIALSSGDGNTNVRITRSVIEDVQSSGVRSSNRDSGVVVDRTTVSGVGGEGIVVDGANGLVKRCTVTQAGGDGIQTFGDDSPVTRSEVLIAGGEGIQTFGLRSPVTRCLVEDTGDEGVQTFGEDSPIFKTTAARSGTDALQTFAARSPVTKCTVRGCGGEGVQTFDVDCPVVRCRVFDTFEEGIQTFDPGGDVIGCTVVGAGSDGIETFSDGLTISLCKVIDCGVDAFRIGTVNATVRRNFALRAGRHGFVTVQTGILFQQNTSRNAVQDGFRMESGGNELIKNRGAGSGGFDLSDVPAMGTGENVFSKNRFGTESP